MSVRAGLLIMQVQHLCSLFVAIFPVISFVLEPDLTWDACQLDLSEEYRTISKAIKKQSPCKYLDTVENDWVSCDCYRCNDSDLSHAVCDIDLSPLRENQTIPLLPSNVKIVSLYYFGHLRVGVNFFANVSDDQRITSLLMIKLKKLTVSKGSLTRLKHLECLNLDHSNMLSPLDVFEEILTLPKLKRISLRSVFWGQQRNIQNTFSLLPWNATKSVRSLWLSNNLMGSVINLDNFHWVPTLSRLDLSFNHIKEITVFRPVTIEVLDLSHNEIESFIETFTYRWYTLYPFMKKLNMSHNNIKSMYSYLDNIFLSNLTELDLSHNLILIISSNFLKMSKFPSLTFLYLNNQMTSHPVTIEDSSFCGSPKLSELSLDFCNLHFALTDPHGDLVSKQFLQLCIHLQCLSLEGCHLQAVDENSFVEYFNYLVSLQSLNLAGTGLGFVSSKAFSVFSNLTRLILHTNAITHVPDGCFDSLLKLQELDLSRNKIPVISQQTFSLPLRRQFNNLQLRENPFVCSCNLLWFSRWLASNSSLFIQREPSENIWWYLLDGIRVFRGPVENTSRFGLDGYRCIGPPEKHLSDFVLTDQACLLSKEMSIMIILTTVIFILTFTGSLLAFSYRWHLRLLFYQAFRGPGDIRRRHLQQGTFMYDVFVSYASEDLPWVREQLMPELEDRLGLRLCLHQRDFIPGQDIVDNIVDSVSSSKKVVMVFSNHFVKSQWCQFELSFCLRHVMDVEDALIVLCLDDVASRDMTSAMMAVLKTTTYLQWAEERGAVEAFWDRLRQAFGEILNVLELAV